MNKQLSEEQLLKLSPEELYNHFDHLAEATVYKMYHHPDKFAASIGMEIEDFFQFSRIGLWQGCNTLHTTDHNRTVKNFLIQNMRWSVSRHIERMTVSDRIYKSRKPTEDNLVTVLSMSGQPLKDQEEDSTYYDITSTDGIYNFDSVESYPENIIINKSLQEGLLEKLDDFEKELINLRLGNDQLTYREIAEIYGVSKQRIGMRFKKIQQKCQWYLQKQAVAY